MKQILIIFAIRLLIEQVLQAQGTTTYLSNLGQTSIGSNPVGSDSWIATDIYIANNTAGYTVNSVQLGMNDASGNPSAFSVMIYSAIYFSGVNPGNSLATFEGSLNPTTGGIYTYTPSTSLTLSPNRDYFLVVSAGTAIANGAYDWSLTNPNLYNPSGGWRGGGVWNSTDGSHWFYVSGSPQFAITATAVPEPSPSALLLLGTGILFYVRRRK